MCFWRTNFQNSINLVTCFQGIPFANFKILYAF